MSKEQIRAAIATKLKAYREAKGKKQWQMAKILSIPRPRYASYEEGRATPPFVVIVNISKVLDVDIQELTGLGEAGKFVS